MLAHAGDALDRVDSLAGSDQHAGGAKNTDHGGHRQHARQSPAPTRPWGNVGNEHVPRVVAARSACRAPTFIYTSSKVNDVTSVEAMGDPAFIEHDEPAIRKHIERSADNLGSAELDANGLTNRGEVGAVGVGDVIR